MAKEITKQELLTFDIHVQEAMSFYESENKSLRKENAQLKEDKLKLLEQLKQALNAQSGIGFAN